MGKIGKCCCAEAECCLCDEAWEFDNWSVTVLGKTFSGTFSPAEKPDPFTVANGCQSRQGDDCIIDEPTTLLDCVQETDWGGRAYVQMSSAPVSPNPIIQAADCPQCECLDNTAMQDDEYCTREGLLVWETESKGVTHSRAWQQEAFYGVAQMICCDSPASSVKFIFDLYYHVARFAATSTQAFRRFRSVAYDCIYEPGQIFTDPTSTYVYGSWVVPVAVGSKPPCYPCSWDQTDFFGQCDTLDSNCDPCIVCDPEVVTYTMYWEAISGVPIDLTDDDADLECPIPDIDPVDGNRIVFTGSTTMNAFVGTGTNYCENALSTFGENCTVSPTSAVIEYRFMSDCILCSEIPCTVTLARTTGTPLDESIIECLFNEDLDCDCGSIYELCKTIPASVSMVLTPCT